MKYLLALSILLFTNSAIAEPPTPDLLGIHLGGTVQQAERACRKHGGKWFTSQMNLFACKSSGFNATVEANGNSVVFRVFVAFKQVKFYNKELKSFILNYSALRSTETGANNTVINNFVNDKWVTNFESYGNNGNYSAHLYNIKEMLNK